LRSVVILSINLSFRISIDFGGFMLSRIRNNMKAFSLPLWIVAASFVGTIFLVWGRGSVSGPSTGQVATINGYPISATEFYRQVANLSKDYEKRFGEDYKKIINEKQIKRLALNQLIVRKLLLHQADKEGIKVSDWAVANRIKSFSFLQKDGNFSEELYREFLKLNRLTAKAFEDMIREDLKIEKIRSVIISEPSVINDELNRLYKLNFGKRKFKYKIFLASQFSPKVSEKEVKQFYEENKFMFKSQTKSVLEAVKIPKKDPKADELVEEAFKMAKSGKLEKINGYLVFKPDKALSEKLNKVIEKNGKNYGFFEDTKNYYVFIKKVTESIQPFEKVKTAIEIKLKKRKAKALAKESAIKFLNSPNAKFDGETNFINKEEMFTKFKLVSSKDLNAMYEAKKGSLVGPFEVLDGYMVVKPVSDIEVKEIDNNKMKDLRDFIIQTKKEASFEAYVNALKNRATIKINDRYLR
jgi:peptidyl-prolyl cis-trans isomerase D